MFDNASALEIAWTALALPGLLLSIYNVHGALRDLRTHWLDGFRAMGWIGLSKVANVLVQAAMVLAIGLAAMAVPEPLRPENQDVAAFAAGCFMVIDVGIFGAALMFFLERRVIVPMIKPPPEDRA